MNGRRRPSLAASTHFERHREVAGVLAEEGLFWLIDEAGLARFAPKWRRKSADAAKTEQHIRHALERLGVTFIKAGQALSTRTDVIPPELAAELSKLQDEVTSTPFDVMRAVLESELEMPLSEAFDSFRAEPIGTASIGQVYRAVLPDGTPVAVKIQRPGVMELAEVDLDILMRAARTAQGGLPDVARHDLAGLAGEFADALWGEFDYGLEARNTERLRQAFEGVDTVVIPRVYWAHTTSRVLTTELLDGVRMNRLEELEAAGLDRAALALNGINAYLYMIFDVGVFHADPHPGNFIALEGNRVGFTDFGRVGSMSLESRERFIDLLHAVVNRDPESATEALLMMATAPDIDESMLQRDVARLIGKYHGRDLEHINTADLFGDALALFRDNRLGVPNDFAVMLATLVVLEGVGKMLDPAFDFASAVTPFAERAMKDRLKPAELLDRFGQDLRRGIRTMERMPVALDRIMRRAARGEFRLEVAPREYESLIEQISELVNRLAFAIIVAALIMGATTLLSTTGVPRWLSFVGQVGLVAALLVSFWFFGSIFVARVRSSRRR